MSLKRLVSKVLPVAASFIPGVGGVIAGAVSKTLSKPKVSPMGLVALGGPGAGPGQRGIQPLTRPGFTTGGVMGMPTRGGGMPRSRGFPNDMGLPPTDTNVMLLFQRGWKWNSRLNRWVRRPRMNPTNVHALRRALRRVEGFVRIEKRVDKILGRAAPRRAISTAAKKSGFVRSRKR
jgi:hypothetical protein